MGEISALPRLPSGSKGPTFKREGREGRREKGGEGRGIGREGKGPPLPPSQIPGSAPEYS